MPEVQLKDDAGNPITLFQHNGKLFPNFKAETITNMRSLKLREDDIMISAYPKSGTHWMFEVIRMLYAGTTDVKIISKVETMIEDVSQEILDKLESPRILNSHVAFRDLPTDLPAKKPKIIFIRRNPKDLVVSFFNHCSKISQLYHYNGGFKDFLKLFVDGKVEYNSWFDQTLDWERVMENNKDVPILHLTYEDMKEDLPREMKRVCDFLGIKINDEQIEKIAEACDFSNMQKRKGHILADESGKSKIYRKGEVGDWKNWFTVAQSEWFDQVYKERMAGSKLKFRYTLDREEK